MLMIKRLLIAAVAIVAVIIPAAAGARPDGPDQPYWDAAAAVQAATPAPGHEVTVTSVSGFSWHDAALGAAGMLVLVGVGTGATLAVRRRAILS